MGTSRQVTFKCPPPPDWSIFSGILLLLQSLPITKKMSLKRANTLVF